MASSSASRNWLYDVFLSFRGEDVRVTFRSHFIKELDRKLITAFKDNEMERSNSLWPELEQAIKESRIAVVLFSKNYASSSWCLKELLEIVNCNDNIVIPVFYGLDPSDVRKQTGEFGKIFNKTCEGHTEEDKNQWKKALTDVANMLGFDSATWDNEAKMIEEIANDVLGKLLSTTPKDSEELVGMEDHIAEMSLLLQLESEEVRMVGIWGSSGIGKTTIARALFTRLSRHFGGSTFIDRAFVSKSRNIYSGANPDDPNMKLQLQGNFLSEILGIKDIKIDDPSALRERLKHQKVLIVIDDLDDLMVLDTLVGQTQWFGSGSRIIVVTNNKYFLRAHRIEHIYEVSFPTEEHAFQMLCQSAFGKKAPLEDFEMLIVEVARHAGSLPLSLTLLGKSLRWTNQESWTDMLPRLENGLDDKIEKILRISYDGLRSADEQAIFCHIACLFNHMEVSFIESLLADSNLGVTIGLKSLADKSLIHVRDGSVVMHRSLQEMGRRIVRTQSIDKPGERTFLVDSKDICDVLSACTGTEKVLGISLDISEMGEFNVPKSSFKQMHNLRFLEIEDPEFILRIAKLHLPESLDYLPLTLKLLCWPNFPMRCMPSNFCPKNLVSLKMPNNKLYKLWEGVVDLTCLKEMYLYGSVDLKKIPDLSMATNLVTLNLMSCKSLVELPPSIRNLNKLLELNMAYCNSLKTLPTGFNLKSLDRLYFYYCSELRTFPEFSTNISVLNMYGTNIEEFPSNLHLENLVDLEISSESKSAREPWEGVKKLFFTASILIGLNISPMENRNTLPEYCLETMPEYSFVLPLTPFLAMLSPTLKRLELKNIASLVELPPSFQNLNQLKYLKIMECINLETLPIGINLQSLDELNFSGCSRLRSFPDISTNISKLNLKETGIEKVPWWIEKFTNLTKLSMESCCRLKCVSLLHIFKLKHLEEADFKNCGALTKADLSGYLNEMLEMMKADNIDTLSVEVPSSLPEVSLDFRGCFRLDPETVLRGSQPFIFKSMIFSEEELPSYFTHHTTGSSSLTIPLHHVPISQPFFRFRVGAVANNHAFKSTTAVKCELKDRSGNTFHYGFDFEAIKYIGDYPGKCRYILVIMNCCIPLNEDNAPLAQRSYDHVEMHIPNLQVFTSLVKGWGVRVLEECSLPEN